MLLFCREGFASHDTNVYDRRRSLCVHSYVNQSASILSFVTEKICTRSRNPSSSTRYEYLIIALSCLYSNRRYNIRFCDRAARRNKTLPCSDLFSLLFFLQPLVLLLSLLLSDRYVCRSLDRHADPGQDSTSTNVVFWRWQWLNSVSCLVDGLLIMVFVGVISFLQHSPH